MIVTCDVVRCGYYTSGYCGKPVLRILQNGACGYLYKQDLTPRETAVAAKSYKERLEIIEVECKEEDKCQDGNCS